LPSPGISGFQVTNLIHGPFCIVVTNPQSNDDADYPVVVAPEGGFKTKDEARGYIEKHFAHRKEPYLGLFFKVQQLSSGDDFIRFCSWES
jgi:hypothetical protein